MTKRILSGIQPTGSLHIGNYLGAMQNWVKMQDEGEAFYCIVDMHAITLPYDTNELQKNVLGTAAAYLAAGIDPEKADIFVQSSVLYHGHLAWILGTLTPMGWLSRMTQFKDKSQKMKQDQIGYGLMAYPVLQAADILLYRATHVPIGEDQKQHLELCRDIAGAFNRAYHTDYFTLPEPIIPKNAARIMSLRDGTKKMSKSDESAYSRIHLGDSADEIALKLRKAKSDADVLPGDVKSLDARPEALNLLSIYSTFKGCPLEESVNHFAGKNFSSLKQELTDVTVATLEPITVRMNDLLKDEAYLKQIIQKGNDKANSEAHMTMKRVQDIVGFWKL